MTKIALIPAYEPEFFLLTFLPQVREAGFEIILIDDGSGAALHDGVVMSI